MLSRGFGALFALLMNVFGLLFEPLQRLIGARRMPYVFLLPNLLIFSVFILFPMLLNFYYAFTGGTNLFPADRPFVGTENFERLFDCSIVAVPGPPPVRTYTSSNICTARMSARMRTTIIVGMSSGRVTRRKLSNEPAPSMAAAS